MVDMAPQFVETTPMQGDTACENVMAEAREAQTGRHGAGELHTELRKTHHAAYHHNHHYSHHIQHAQHQPVRRAPAELPSALHELQHLRDALRTQTRTPVFLLDYDGTLSPIVEDPSQAFLPEHTRETLRELSKQFPIAIVSGRALNKVMSFVELESLIYAGSHGFEICGPNADGFPSESRIYHQVAREFIPSLKEALLQIWARVQQFKGCSIEENGVCFSVHYRCARPEDVPAILDAVNTVLGNFPSLKRTAGKCVFEVRPRIEWNKGKAVEWLLTALDLTDDRVIPVYIGDDKTDEDAFRVLSGRGICCLVSDDTELRSHSNIEEDATYANYRLRNPHEVYTFLENFRRLVST